MRGWRALGRSESKRVVPVLVGSLLFGLLGVGPSWAQGTFEGRLSVDVDQDADFVDDVDFDIDSATVFYTGLTREQLRELRSNPVPGLEATSNMSIEAGASPGDDIFDVAIEFARTFDDFQTANLGSGGALAEFDVDFAAALDHLGGGFSSDTVELEATIELDGSIGFSWPTDGLSGRGSLLLSMSDRGSNSDEKGIFFSGAGGVVGNADLASVFTSSTSVIGPTTTREFVASDGEVLLTLEVGVDPGEISDEQALRFGFGVELGFLNTSGADAAISELALASFIGSSVSLKSLRATDPNVSVTIVPEPSPALALLLGLAGLSGYARRGSASSGRSGSASPHHVP